MMNSFTSVPDMGGSIIHEFEPMFEPRPGHNAFKGPERRKVLTDDDMAQARAEAFAQGQADAHASIERASGESLRAIASMMQMMLGRLSEEAQSLRQEATDVALIAARVIAGSALDAFGEEAVADILATAASQLRDTPRLVVRVSPDLAATIEERLIGCAREAGFGGEIAVRGDPAAQSGDCTLDWGDGTITHSREASFEAIELAAKKWLGSAQLEGFQLDMFQT